MKLKNTLLIVYKQKDEVYFKHLKELIDSFDDTEDSIVGTEDGTVRPMRCEERKWLKWAERSHDGNTKRLADKYLFIGDIKGIELDSPQYSRYGVKFGPLNKQYYAINVDEDYDFDENSYANFMKELNSLVNNDITEVSAFDDMQDAKDIAKKAGAGAAAALVLFPPAAPFFGGIVGAGANDYKKSKDILRAQMLYFAVTKAYLEGLEDFMKCD